MKKIFALLCATILLLTGCGAEKPAAPAKDKCTIGVITHLNASEENYNNLMQKLEKSYRPSKANLSANYKYFNTLTEMQLALESRQIDMLSTYACVADYMIQRNPNMEIVPSERVLSDSFCFAFRNGDTMLKEAFDDAIKTLTDNGTLTNLSKTYIVDLKDKKEPPAVEMPHIDGADTIKVAVTGDLPPFDYVDSNGKPAGFNTALLAEISKIIGKNIEIISVDSASRAAILTSKGADVVFWVCVPNDNPIIPANIDCPDGMALSQPYYSENIVHVELKH